MRQTKLFVKTIKYAPKDETSANARLLARAGFVDKLNSGIYIFSPLGLRVLEKVEKIISEEIEAIQGQRILMPGLVPKKNWEQTGRWKTLDDLYKVKGRGGQEYGLGATHEEVIVPFMQKYISSYKDLPCYIYQIQDKFRDELRAKSGILRGREFIMKDLYSFHTTEKDLDIYYEKAKKTYFKIFKRCGIDAQTHLCLADGGSFSKYSHEFQTITSAGEDTIYICENCGLAINKEIKPEHAKCPECGKAKFKQEKAIEVGNIFKLRTKYTEPFNFTFTDKDGSKKLVEMGCYGIGLPRLIGTAVEIHYDDKGIIWPKEIAPYLCHLIQIGDSVKVKKQAEKIYKDLEKQGIEVLFDDRQDKAAGEKFADADLIGIPYRVVVSARTLEKNSVEIKQRNNANVKLCLLKQLKSKIL
jgi:prolyl-tRNA synthetase